MGNVILRTAIPGPNSQALLARRSAAIPRGVFNTAPIFAARATGRPAILCFADAFHGRRLMPLVIEEPELEEGLAILEAGLARVMGEPPIGTPSLDETCPTSRAALFVALRR